MRGRINIISLDLNIFAVEYPNFLGMTAAEKFAIVRAAIDKISTKLEQTDPTAMNIIVWREYGISNSKSKFVDHAFKADFKKQLLELASQHPSIAIIAGTVATRKHFKTFTAKRIKDIVDEYLDNPTLPNEVALSHISAIERLSMLRAKTLPDGITIVKNTAYIIQGNVIKRRDKAYPHDETLEFGDETETNFIFKPGKSKTRNPIVSLTHPFTGEVFDIGIEICAEHVVGHLGAFLQDHPDANNPLIHFVLSASAYLSSNNVYGKILLHTDSVHDPILAVYQKTGSPINHYVYHLFDSTEVGAEMPIMSHEESMMINNLNILLNEELDDPGIREELTLIFEEDTSTLRTLAKFGQTWTINSLRKDDIVRKYNEDTPEMPLPWLAAENGSTPTLRKLLKIPGVNLNSINEQGQTIAHIAAKNGRDNILRFLIEKKIDVHQPDKNGVTPLMLATANGYPSCINLLTKRNEQTNDKTINTSVFFKDSQTKSVDTTPNPATTKKTTHGPT